MSENKENWLATFLNKNREIIEAAETPFSKLAIFILPIIAPFVPAILTGLHVYKLLLEIFKFQYANQVSMGLAFIVSLVLELLGYVGAILFIQSIFRWIRYRRDEYLVPSALNGLAYLFYLSLMYLINVQLGTYFETPRIMNNIVGLLSFITVPTSLLAANHLSQKEEAEEDAELRREKREFQLEKMKIKYGSSGGSSNGSSETTSITSRTKTEVPEEFQKSSRTGRKPVHQERVFSYIEEQLSLRGVVPSFTDITNELNLPQSTVSRLRNEWIAQHG